MAKVFLDAGHGGKDPGALGNGLREKDINLSVALKVGNILKNHGVDVRYSRTTDTFLELHERTDKANKSNADIFVSIHVNSAGNKAARGVETFSYSGSSKGTALAKCIQDSLVKSGIFSHNRGIKTANFAVLRRSKMPAALPELGFISNKEDATILRNRQDEMANAVAKGILNYLGIKYIENNTVKEEKKLDKIKVNLHRKQLDVEGIYREGTNYIPIRFLESLGYKIDWENGTVVIDYKED